MLSPLMRIVNYGHERDSSRDKVLYHGNVRQEKLGDEQIQNVPSEMVFSDDSARTVVVRTHALELTEAWNCALVTVVPGVK